MNIKYYYLKFKLRFCKTFKSKDFSYLLRKHGIKVGEHCAFFDPRSLTIDVTRPHLLSIGNYVVVTSGVTILAHDYSRVVFCNHQFYSNVGEARETIIGDNVFIGMNSIVLMGARIGNNSIVGAGSVVSGSFPDNSVIAGNPAKLICTLEQIYEKRKAEEINAAKLYAKKFYEVFHKKPTITDMTNAFSWLYLDRTDDTLKNYQQLFVLNGVNREQYIEKFLKSKPYYESFEVFLDQVFKNSKDE